MCSHFILYLFTRNSSYVTCYSCTNRHLKHKSKWDTLDLGLLTFTDILVQQKEKANKTLKTMLLSLRKRTQSFIEEWEDHKRCLLKESMFDDVEAVKILDGFSRRLRIISNEADHIQEKCTNFNTVESINFSALDVVKQDVKRSTEGWHTIQEYKKELESLSEQAWIRFRDDISRLQSFCRKWESCLDSLKDNPRATKYLTDLSNISALAPVLKLCIGDCFREDHWAELLQGKLQLPQTVRVENLTLVHFITTRDILQQSSTLIFLKDLQSRCGNLSWKNMQLLLLNIVIVSLNNLLLSNSELKEKFHSASQCKS